MKGHLIMKINMIRFALAIFVVSAAAGGGAGNFSPGAGNFALGGGAGNLSHEAGKIQDLDIYILGGGGT